ncbi:hypothetical protein QFZ83_002436 [Variovorax sp. W1I1]|uniref:hypothetical protein n=1 Tax=Variovorax sp. W1I1 TaxID=3042309 RepID=UPI002786A123|nr:hypothetical protein [Variovorax sp. W1I1]
MFVGFISFALIADRLRFCAGMPWSLFFVSATFSFVRERMNASVSEFPEQLSS